MNRLFSCLALLIQPAPAAAFAPADSVANDLMERAGADAGRNPREADELRSAALAFLSVVR